MDYISLSEPVRLCGVTPWTSLPEHSVPSTIKEVPAEHSTVSY